MKTKIKLSGQTKFRLNSRLAEKYAIEDGDIYDVDINKDQILLSKQNE